MLYLPVRKAGPWWWSRSRDGGASWPYEYVDARVDNGAALEWTRRQVSLADHAGLKVRLRFISNSAARVAALLAGDVQMIENVPTADVARLEKVFLSLA